MAGGGVKEVDMHCAGTVINAEVDVLEGFLIFTVEVHDRSKVVEQFGLEMKPLEWGLI